MLTASSRLSPPPRRRDWASVFPFARRSSKRTVAGCGSSKAAPTERNSVCQFHSDGRNCSDSRSINRFCGRQRSIALRSTRGKSLAPSTINGMSSSPRWRGFLDHAVCISGVCSAAQRRRRPTRPCTRDLHHYQRWCSPIPALLTAMSTRPSDCKIVSTISRSDRLRHVGRILDSHAALEFDLRSRPGHDLVAAEAV